MHWVIQENIYNEDGLTNLIDFLAKMEIPHTEVKVVPFVGDIIPDLDLGGPVMCLGSYSLRKIAAKKNWKPGVFDIEKYDYRYYIKHWGTNMLNHDATIRKFGEIEPIADRFFIRPIHDSKNFAGKIETAETFKDWQYNVVQLGRASYDTLDSETLVMMCALKKIYNEYRCWIVDGKIVTISMYVLGGKVVYKEESPPQIVEFVEEMLKLHCLDIPFVMDVGDTRNGMKIIELNTLNAAGLYAADVQKLVIALEEYVAQ